MSFKCVKMFCSPPIMYISLMNSVSTEHPVYLFSQASSYVPIYCSNFKSGIYLVLNDISINFD